VYFGKYIGNANTNIMSGGTAVGQDRLGSTGKYFPYGEEHNSPQLPNDAVKFATYTRDSATGLDYADQRYFNSGLARFMTPDPYVATATAPRDPTNPLSWNRYVYVLGDPIGFKDPTGLKTYPGDEPNTGPSEPTHLGSGAGSATPPGCVLIHDSRAEYPLPDILWCPQGGGEGVGGGASRNDKRSRTGLECAADVIAAMITAWYKSGNGTTGKEAGFVLIGTASSYTIQDLPYTNQDRRIDFDLPKGSFALFHVHPTSGDPNPSEDDISLANRKNLQMFTEGSKGLYQYDPTKKIPPTQLTEGLDWTKPCQ
jgi:RHS repeat-associated protein